MTNQREQEVTDIMTRIPEYSRYRWCGGESGPCACMGCVQIFNRKVIAEEIEQKTIKFDPEYISESLLQKHETLYTKFKITKDEWLHWRNKNPQPVEVSPHIHVLNKKLTLEEILKEIEQKSKTYKLEDPIEYLIDVPEDIKNIRKE